MSYPKFVFSWASDLIAIFAFMTGAGAIAAGLSIAQALLALTIAMVISVVLLSLNGLPGFRFGIPMIIQMRPCFGDKAASYVSALRAIPSILWTGYNSFLGALGLNLFSIILFGYDNIWLWFFVFHFAQVLLSMLGVKKILNFTAYAAIALFVVIIIMGCYVFYLYGTDNIAKAASSGGGSAMAFIGVITANVSMCITVSSPRLETACVTTPPLSGSQTRSEYVKRGFRGKSRFSLEPPAGSLHIVDVRRIFSFLH